MPFHIEHSSIHSWRLPIPTSQPQYVHVRPSLDESWTIDVAKPADWDESAPVIETQTEEVKEVMAKVDSQLETIGFTSGTDPLTVFAGIAIAGGLLVWGVLGMLSSGSSDKDKEE